MSIVVTNLSHVYLPGSPLETTSLKDISLKVEEGEFVALLGPTGSGKSTLVQHFNGLLKPHQGSVVVNGINIGEAKGAALKKLRREVGLLFQYPENQLFEETVFDDVAFGPRNLGMSRDETEIKVAAAMEWVGLNLDAFRDRSPFALSGGQMRRVALAGVLAMDPRVLILDEPTAGMDPRGRREIRAFLQTLHEQGRTIILISHRMEDVAGLADRILVLHQGRLILDALPRRVFGDAELLRSIGLDIPQAADLCQVLRTRGYPVRTDVLNLEEACSEITGLYRRKTDAGKDNHRAVSSG